MLKKDAFKVVRSEHVTEKAMMLQNLKNSESNRCVKRCKSPKYVFIVDYSANKQQIKEAIESIYSDRNIKVVSVNTINVKPKARRVRGRLGLTAAYKKAVVTLDEKDSLDNV